MPHHGSVLWIASWRLPACLSNPPRENGTVPSPLWVCSGVGCNPFTKALVKWNHHDRVHQNKFYVNSICESIGCDTPALIIMDNFKGKITNVVNSLLEANNIYVCLLPPNTTDCLQPMDVSINKPAKDFSKMIWRLVLRWDDKAAWREGHQIY